MTALKDYEQAQQFKGIGVLIVIFCVGLVGSIFLYASFAIGRFYALSTVVRGVPKEAGTRSFCAADG